MKLILPFQSDIPATINALRGISGANIMQSIGQSDIEKHHVLIPVLQAAKWKVGAKIDFWTGNPNVVTASKYATAICTHVHEVEFLLTPLIPKPNWGNHNFFGLRLHCTINGKTLEPQDITRLARAEGCCGVFSLINRLMPRMRVGEPFRMRLICWGNGDY